MRKRLKPFNPNAMCPKCGHDVVRVSYSVGGCPYPADCGVSAAFDDGEHLDRTCQRCHYEWAEAVMRQPTAALVARVAAEEEG